MPFVCGTDLPNERQLTTYSAEREGREAHCESYHRTTLSHKVKTQDHRHCRTEACEEGYFTEDRKIRVRHASQAAYSSSAKRAEDPEIFDKEAQGQERGGRG